MQSKIKTVEIAFAYTGRKMPTPTDFEFLPEKDRTHAYEYYLLTVLVEALNKEANNGVDWYPDWSELSKHKYYPYFKARNEGLTLEEPGSETTHTGIPTPLYFINENVARFAATHFFRLYSRAFRSKNVIFPKFDGKSVTHLYKLDEG